MSETKTIEVTCPVGHEPSTVLESILPDLYPISSDIPNSETNGQTFRVVDVQEGDVNAFALRVNDLNIPGIRLRVI